MEFYNALGTPERKDQFLRVANFYFYLVQRGDWVTTAPNCNSVVDYLSNSYKMVGIFALVESLSEERHEDFFTWLNKRDLDETFPIASKERLAELHRDYKATYGSIRRCVDFFARLPVDRQKMLCNAVKLNRKPLPNIKKFAEFLYTIRSKFVHEADLVLWLSGSSIRREGSKTVHTELTIPVIMSAMEEGLVAYFREKSPLLAK
ncbi:hypothetical protein [Allohahella marinimesophila]|uniref:Abi-like protein n=1 Tax=Allohahella marinimesophila TaxID=1054972 RepID=A0ABP7NXP8_9GAMM